MKGQTQVVNHHLHSPGLDSGNLGAHRVKVSGLAERRTKPHEFIARSVASYLDGSLGLLEFHITYSFNTGVDEEITRAFVQGQVCLEDKNASQCVLTVTVMIRRLTGRHIANKIIFFRKAITEFSWENPLTQVSNCYLTPTPA